MKAVKLIHRSLLTLKGKETISFLQGLLSADMYSFDSSKCLYSFLLNAKGRIVSDLIVYKHNEEEVSLETDKNKIDDLERLLKIYKLRKKIDIIRDPIEVNFLFPDSNALDGAIDDPRLGKKFGSRYLGQIDGNIVDVEEYVRRRLEFGIGEGTYELFDYIPLNVNGDILNGISFDKGMNQTIIWRSNEEVTGCYIGQELIARTHHTGIIRKRLMPFKTKGMPKDGSHILDLEGKRRGKVVKALDGIGIGVVSVEAVGTKIPLISDKKEPMEFYRPDWWPSHVKLGPPE